MAGGCELSGLSGHAHDRWKGNWQSYDVVVSDQDNQQLMELSSSCQYGIVQSREQHWRGIRGTKHQYFGCQFECSCGRPSTFSDGFNVVTR